MPFVGRLATLIFLIVSVSGGSSQAADAKRRGDPSARLAAAGSASEYWAVVTSFESGHFLFARFLITNEGPGSKTGVGMGSLLFPDGRVANFQYGRREGSWTLAPDGLWIDVASSTLDLRGPVRHLQVDSTKSGLQIQLDFAPLGDSLWAPEAGPSGHSVDLVQIPAPVVGTIWTRGMAEPLAVRGTIAVTHTWMDDNEASLMQRQVEFFARDGDMALYLSDLTTPGGERHHWLAVARAGTVVVLGQEFEIALGAPMKAGEDPGYPLPQNLQIRGPGLTATVRAMRQLLRTNPMELIPQLFRFFLSLLSQPRQVWASASFDLQYTPQGVANPLSMSGTGVMALNYLNPLPAE